MGTKENTSSGFKYFLLSFYFLTAFSSILSVISDHHFKTTCSSGNSSYSFVEASTIVSKTFQAIILFNVSQFYSLLGYQKIFLLHQSVRVPGWVICVKNSELLCIRSHFRGDTALCSWCCVSAYHLHTICQH